MSLSIKDTDRILVVAPHPDDETIGCGGLLALYGRQCDVLLLTDGRKGYLSADKVNEDELAKTREDELRSAAEIAGVREVFSLRIPDGAASENKETITSFNISPYNLISVPNRQERHKDHSVVEGLFESMRKSQNSTAELFEYEVWSPIARPTHSLDISGVIDIKERMISQYRSQIKYVDYVSMAISLSKYRGAGFNAQYAEVFSVVRKKKNIFRRTFDRLPVGLKSFAWKLINKLRNRCSNV